MKTSGNTVLITGGSSGIGLALAESFLHHNTVIICGRREHALEDVKRKHPGLHTRVCDIANEDERRLLFEWASENFPQLNILINNAGIQRIVDVKKGIAALDGEDEIEVNLKALVDLSIRFTSFLEKQHEAAIMNVSSGLAFAPLAIAPVYCATKAAVHSFTMSLRYQLKDTNVKVFEIIPPRVATALGTKDRREIPDGIPASEIASTVLDAMQHDKYEIAVGMAEGLRKDPQAAFERMNH